ncbi:MAG: hypothetical protein WAR79_01020 [Melioribacteraceae bacterium]
MKNLILSLAILFMFSFVGCDQNNDIQSEQSKSNTVEVSKINQDKNKKEESQNSEAVQKVETLTEPCDEEASRYVLANMSGLTSKIDKANRTYFISHSLWESMSYPDKKGLITAVADAHACLENKANEIKFIDDYTDKIIAKAHPDLGIDVLD